MTGNEIRKVVEIDASPETVFRAISDPKELTNWFPDAVTFEPRAGGKFRFSFSRTQLGVVEKGMVIRLTKEKFLNLYQTKNLFIHGNGMVLQTFLRLL